MKNVESSQSICGRNITLPVDDYKHEVLSYGEVVGDCSVTFVLNISSACPCKICMRQDKLTLDADVMNITFTGETEKVRLAYVVLHKNTLNIHMEGVCLMSIDKIVK